MHFADLKQPPAKGVASPTAEAMDATAEAMDADITHAMELDELDTPYGDSTRKVMAITTVVATTDAAPTAAEDTTTNPPIAETAPAEAAETTVAAEAVAATKRATWAALESTKWPNHRHTWVRAGNSTEFEEYIHVIDDNKKWRLRRNEHAVWKAEVDELSESGKSHQSDDELWGEVEDSRRYKNNLKNKRKRERLQANRRNRYK